MIDTPAQPRVGRIFERLISSERLASSYLFYGPSGSGKWHSAIQVAAEVLSEGDGNAAERARKLLHPDLKIIYPTPTPRKKKKSELELEIEEINSFFRESKLEDPFSPVKFDRAASIKMDNVREFQRELYKSPLESDYRVAIIEKAETMPKSSFDIMLKTIEEPPPKCLIIMLSDNFDRLPETIRSRCQKIRFKRIGPDFMTRYLIEQKNLDEENAKFIASLSFGSISRAEKLIESDFIEERETAVTLLGYLLSNPIDKFWLEFQGMINFRDRERVENLLVIWQTIYHDISLLSSGVDTRYLINRDHHKDIVKLAKLVGGFENSRKGMGNLLALQKMFYRNLNPLPSFYEVSQRLKSRLEPLEVRD